jgi:hypothetical protein
MSNTHPTIDTRRPDPQLNLIATLRRATPGPNGEDRGEYLVFTMDVLFFRLTFIVNIPGEDEDTSPVWVRGKINWRWTQSGVSG